MVRKILIPIFSRGNYAKLKNIILELSKCSDCEPIVVIGGTASLDRYGDLRETMKSNGIINFETLNFVVTGEDLSAMRKTAGLASLEFSNLFEKNSPDIVLILADRFECLPLAMIARYSNKCIVHLEGGEVTGSVDDSIRHAISKLSNYHLVANQSAKEVLKRLGESSDNIFITGSTSFDEFQHANIDGLAVMRNSQKIFGLGQELKLIPKSYGVCIYHPVTTEYDDNFKHCNTLLEVLSEHPEEIVWLWPNMDAGSDGVSKAIRKFREKNEISNIHFFKSLPIEKYAPLLKYAKFIIGNSSSGIREAGFVGVPSITIGTRQKGRERSQNVFTINPYKDEIVRSLKDIKEIKFDVSHLYSETSPSKKVADLLLNFTIKNEKFYGE
jgi:UDP-hydrolysing UDP-N-acetyl-D-glucosamine 2-epimerase